MWKKTKTCQRTLSGVELHRNNGQHLNISNAKNTYCREVALI